jgi:hypothetical protein
VSVEPRSLVVVESASVKPEPASATPVEARRGPRHSSSSRASSSPFVLYTWLASLVDVPRVHPDEVRYLIAASSLVEGEA